MSAWANMTTRACSPKTENHAPTQAGYRGALKIDACAIPYGVVDQNQCPLAASLPSSAYSISSPLSGAPPCRAT